MSDEGSSDVVASIRLAARRIAVALEQLGDEWNAFQAGVTFTSGRSVADAKMGAWFTKACRDADGLNDALAELCMKLMPQAVQSTFEGDDKPLSSAIKHLQRILTGMIDWQKQVGAAHLPNEFSKLQAMLKERLAHQIDEVLSMSAKMDRFCDNFAFDKTAMPFTVDLNMPTGFYDKVVAEFKSATEIAVHRRFMDRLT